MKKILRGYGGVTALIRVGLLCLSASTWGSLVRGERGRPRQLEENASSPSPTEEVRMCTPGTTVKLDGAEKEFQFKCDAGSDLLPVEAKPAPSVPGGRQGIDENALKKVYLPATQSRSAEVCGQEEGQLDTLLPDSRLVVVNEGRQVGGQTETVFKLTVGKGKDQDTQFCYTCKPAAAPELPSRTRSNECTIFVTVPAKKEPQPQPPPQKPAPDSDTELTPQPGPQPTPQPDEPSDSGSFQTSVFSSGILVVATSAWGLMVYL